MCAVGYPAGGYSYLTTAPVAPADRLSAAAYLTDYGALPQPALATAALTLPRTDASSLAVNSADGRPDHLALRTAHNGEIIVCASYIVSIVMLSPLDLL